MCLQIDAAWRKVDGQEPLGATDLEYWFYHTGDHEDRGCGCSLTHEFLRQFMHWVGRQ